MQRSRSRRGLTLVELLLSVTFLGLIMTGITMFGRQTTQAFQTGTVNADVNAKLRRTIDKIGAKLRPSGVNMMPSGVPLPGDDAIEFQQSVGVSAGRAVPGPTQTIRLELEAGEIADGIDNNANGLVDEQMVVWYENRGQADERRAVWCRGVPEFLAGEDGTNGLDDNGNGLVDEPGLCFEVVEPDPLLDPEHYKKVYVRVWLTLERMDEDGRTITQSLETSVKLRNWENPPQP